MAESGASSPEPWTATPAPASAYPPLAQIFDDPRVPDVAQGRILTIRGMIDDLDARTAFRGELDQARGELLLIQSVHLPRLLESYIAIPAQHRAEIFRATGRSASFMLTERLDQMIERLREISRTLAQGDLDAFATNIRFIDTRYGAPGSARDWDPLT